MIERRAQFLQVRPVGGEDRVLDRVAQIGQRGGRVVLQDVAPVDPIDFGQTQQHLNRQAALVVLQQVDIGRAEAQRGGHLGLGLAVLAAKLPEPRPDEILLRLH